MGELAMVALREQVSLLAPTVLTRLTIRVIRVWRDHMRWNVDLCGYRYISAVRMNKARNLRQRARRRCSQPFRACPILPGLVGSYEGNKRLDPIKTVNAMFREQLYILAVIMHDRSSSRNFTGFSWRATIP